MKMYDIGCPECGKTEWKTKDGIKYYYCTNCGWNMTDKFIQDVLSEVFRMNKEESTKDAIIDGVNITKSNKLYKYLRNKGVNFDGTPDVMHISNNIIYNDEIIGHYHSDENIEIDFDAFKEVNEMAFYID